jgi:hypothetical protein
MIRKTVFFLAQPGNIRIVKKAFGCRIIEPINSRKRLIVDPVRLKRGNVKERMKEEPSEYRTGSTLVTASAQKCEEIAIPSE